MKGRTRSAPVGPFVLAGCVRPHLASSPMRLLPAVVLATGCGFGPPGASPGGSPSTGDDAAVPSPDGSKPGDPFVPLHVPAGGRAPGTEDLELAQSVDTGALTIDGSASLPAGVVFDMWPQPGGVELAVLHVRGLRVPVGATVRVTGSRALVVVASDAIDISGVLDGSAQRTQPGPGGAGPGAGSGAGRAGSHAGNFRDSGGSGGSFAGTGGRGGSAGGSGGMFGCMALQGPTGGSTYGDRTLTVLVAGSGGGAANASTCGTREPGAGGGAIQLSSATSVRVSGGINAGGGGGGGGRSQQIGASQCDMSAGGGGGSGGAIVLQAPLVEVSGTLAANGGGGGSAGGDFDGNDMPPESDGEDGNDGQLAAMAASGGRDVGAWSSAGGPGAIVDTGGPGQGDLNCDSNGGGGGGGAGRIVLALPSGRTPSVTGTASPASASTTY